MQREMSVVFKHNDPWWIGWSPELEGAFGQGRTLEEARESLREAIQLILDDLAAEDTAGDGGAGLIHERLLIAAS